MVVPESSHDRSRSKESPKNVPSTITIPESDLNATKDLASGGVAPKQEIVMVDGRFFVNSFEQDQSWDDSGLTISGI